VQSGRTVLPLVAFFIMSFAVPGSAGAIAGLLPPDVPQANIPEQYGGPCGFAALNESSACQAYQLAQIDAARASEKTGPMNLPSNYDSLDVTDQIFVVAELERVDRGLPPLLGMTQAAGASAQAGANAGTDPAVPSGSVSYEGVWAGGPTSPLEATYEWMYNDGCGVGPGGGPTSNNISCAASTPWDQSPSWGHRNAILSSLTLPGCADCVAGAAYSTAPGFPSYDLVIAAPNGPTPPLVFSWAGSIRPYLSPQTPGCATTDLSAPQGYALLGADGGAFAFGDVTFSGSLSGTSPVWPVVGIATTPDHHGYWLVNDDGDVSGFGDASNLGSVLESRTGPSSYYPGEVASAIAATPEGNGYWITNPDGDVYRFGDARQFGSLSGVALNAPIVGIAPTPDGGGYWLVASDGGVFGFGDAKFFGSMGATSLNSPVVGMAADPVTGGYWLIAADGGVFAFNAPFFGSMGGRSLVEGIAGMVPATDGNGYRLVAFDGGVFNFGNAAYEGSVACLQLAAPIVAVAS
jgi:hypothetical protein